jgi:uncharacterized protein YciI
MGKTLKFPKRPKYVFNDKKPEKIEEEKISKEEHEERLKKLKELGLLK